MSLLVLSSSWLEESSSSGDMSGRLLVLPPRLRLEEVEEELRPESGTGDPWHSLRKSNPPPGQERRWVTIGGGRSNVRRKKEFYKEFSIGELSVRPPCVPHVVLVQDKTTL